MIKFVVPHQWGGVISSLRNLKSYHDDVEVIYLEKFLGNFWRDLAFWNSYSEPLVLCGGWDSRYDDIIELCSCPIFSYWHSTIYQSELSWGHDVNNEVVYPRIKFADNFAVEFSQLIHIKQLLEDNKISGVFVPSEKMCKPLEFTDHLPNTFNSEEVDFTPRKKVPDSAGCFCAYDPRKNISTQSLGAMSAGKTLYVRKGFPTEYQKILDCLGVNVRHVALPSSHKSMTEYWSFLSSMEVTLQVTSSESLNYAVLESIFCGTPPLFSPACSLYKLDKEFDSFCCIEDIDNPEAISRKINRITRNSLNYERAIMSGKRAAEIYSTKSKPLAEKALQKIRTLST
jgi:hypothetical protein